MTADTTDRSSVHVPGPHGLAFAIGIAASLYIVTLLRKAAVFVGSTDDVLFTALVASTSGVLIGFALAARFVGDPRVGSSAHAKLERGVAVIGAVVLFATPAVLDGFAAFRSVAAIAAAFAVPLAALACLVAILTAGAPRAAGGVVGAASFGVAAGFGVAAFGAIETFGVGVTSKLAAALALVVAVGAQLRTRASNPVVEFAAGAVAETPRRAMSLAFAAGMLAMATATFGMRAIVQSLPATVTALAFTRAVFAGAFGLGMVVCGIHSARAATPWLATACGALFSLAVLAPGPLGERFVPTQSASFGEWGTIAAAGAVAMFLAGLIFAAAFEWAATARARCGVLAWSGVGMVVVALVVAGGIAPATSYATAATVAGLGVGVGLLFAAGGLAWRVAAIATMVLSALPMAVDTRWVPLGMANEQIVARREGLMHDTIVGSGSAVSTSPLLFVDRTRSYSDFAGSPRAGQRRGAIPALLHPRPLRALVLGMGDGSAIEGLLRCGTTSVDLVEASPDMLKSLGYFTPGVGDLRTHPNVTLIAQDPIAFVRTARARYDLVVTTFDHPSLAGASRHVAVEHYEHVRALLDEGGIFCQWIPLHRLRFEEFGAIGETFRSVFDPTLAFLLDLEHALPYVGLIGRLDPIRIDARDFDARVKANAGALAVGFSSAADFYELYLGDGHTLAARFADESGRVDLDSRVTFDRPWLEFAAARTTESELVLALNNLNNLALQLGDSITPWLGIPPTWSPDEKDQHELTIGRRAAAMRQFLLARYWELRGQWVGDDVIGDEQREAEQYGKIVRIDPQHAATLRAIDRLLRRRLAQQRYSQVVELGQIVLGVNSGDVAIGRNVGLALLLLGESAPASGLLAAIDAKGDADAFALTALAVAYFLEKRDGEARAVAHRALAAGAAENNNLARAVAAATGGDTAGARAALERVLEHPQWGSLARRIAERL